MEGRAADLLVELLRHKIQAKTQTGNMMDAYDFYKEENAQNFLFPLIE